VDSRPNRGDFRFPKSARLARAAEFAKVKNHGGSWPGKFMVLSVLKTTEPGSRIGLITSRRIGNAVTRNRARRRLREMVRLSRPHLNDGFWMVLIARRPVAFAEFKEIEREWLSLARRASILAD
jgi:ribonuclease P protein component